MDSFLNNIVRLFRRIDVRRHDRFTVFQTRYPGFLCTVVDKSSFLFMCDEIFKKKIYSFESETETPYIIDGGSNIGLSVIFFKQLFPRAEIVAFEPDPSIYKILQKNLESSGFVAGVTCVQACLTSEKGPVVFYPDGSDGGSKVDHGQALENIEVPAVALSDYLTKTVDFLKLDIEGAEFEVLKSSQDGLANVKNIFVEYHSQAEGEQNLDAILSILKSAGFRYYIEHVGIRSDFPYLSRNSDHGMDLQLNIYGYRI